MRDNQSDCKSLYSVLPNYKFVRTGLGNSDVATATLVWTDAIFTETTPETPTSAKAVQESIPVLISAKGGNISVKCEADGQEVNVYTIDGLSLVISHVGDSRAYLLHEGRLVRVTHDHSFVEELVDAGEITEDEARVHPSRSVITRALGSDPDMYADHFTIDVSAGDRVLLCSDGLSSMVGDSQIEAIAVSSATPQAAVDNLVAAALQEGGHDNVTVVVVDVVDDGVMDLHRRYYLKRFVTVALLIVGIVAALFVAAMLFVRNSWYVGVNGDTVAIYHGVNASLFGQDLYALSETSAVQVKDLPDAMQQSLRDGIVVGSEAEAQATIKSYHDQIEADKVHAQQIADKSTSGTQTSQENPAVPKADGETTEEPEEEAAPDEAAEEEFVDEGGE